RLLARRLAPPPQPQRKDRDAKSRRQSFQRFPPLRQNPPRAGHDTSRKPRFTAGLAGKRARRSRGNPGPGASKPPATHELSCPQISARPNFRPEIIPLVYMGQEALPPHIAVI